MKRYGWFRLPPGTAVVILVISALVVALEPATAQHGGGGGHAGGGGGHPGGGSGHFAIFGGGHSRSSSHNAAANSTHPLRAEPTAAHGAAPLASSVVAPAKESTLFRAAPEHTTIGFPPEPTTIFPAALLHSAAGAPLSFSGEGHQIWQNSPSPATTATTPAVMMRPQPPHIIRPPGFPFPYYPSWFFPVYGFYGFSPFFGWGCSPFYPWTFGCAGYGYGYGYGYGAYYPSVWDQNEPPASEDVSNEPSPSLWQNPPSGEDLQGNAASMPETVIYLQDGTSYQVTDYWLSDNKLHYVTNYGGENSVSLGQIDVQRTVDANAGRGVNFTLHPAPPPSLTPPPSADSAPPDTPHP